MSRYPSLRLHNVALLVALAISAAACSAKPTPSDPAAVDAVTAEAMQQSAIGTADALSKLDSAPAPTSAMAGTQIAIAATAAISSPTGTYAPTDGASDPAAVAAASEGRVGKPVAVWFWSEGCKDCQAVSLAWDKARLAAGGRVAFVRVDTADPAAADAVLRYRVTEPPAFVLFHTDGRPAASFTGWPGEATFLGYLEQAK